MTRLTRSDGFPGPERGSDAWVELAHAELPVDEARRWVTTPSSGAVVVFTGVVRDHSDGRDGVTALTYEAWAEEAGKRLRAVVSEARQRWPAAARMAALHRLGVVPLGEPTVVVAVSAPHRDVAFEAARFCIDTLKETVPVWKREHWEGGSDWAECAHPLRDVADPVARPGR